MEAFNMMGRTSPGLELDRILHFLKKQFQCNMNALRVKMTRHVHLWTGINAIYVPIILMMYEAMTHQHPDLFSYVFAVANIVLNCTSGILMILLRIPKWDLPAIRIFVVAAFGGLSFISLSLNFRFGELESFEVIGRLLSIISLLSIAYALNDCIHHIAQFEFDLIRGIPFDFGFSLQSRCSYQLGLSNRASTLKYCLFTAFFEKLSDEEADFLATVTAVPSNITVVALTLMNVFFGFAGLLQMHYLIWGHRGMLFLQNAFPKLTRMAVYGFLGAALANNFGTFAGTLVVGGKINIFEAAVMNVIAALVPLLEVGIFVYLYNEEENLGDFLWNTILCKMKTDDL